MKVGILAGGLGTRLAEETELRPKPMVEIGGRPILWHIMKILFESYGVRGLLRRRWAIRATTSSGGSSRLFASMHACSMSVDLSAAARSCTITDDPRLVQLAL